MATARFTMTFNLLAKPGVRTGYIGWLNLKDCSHSQVISDESTAEGSPRSLRRMCSIEIFLLRNLTRYGALTSRISEPTKDGYIWLLSWIFTHVRLLAGQCNQE